MPKRRIPKKDNSWTSAAARRLLNAAGNPKTIEESVQILVKRLLDGIPCPPTDLDSLKSRLNIIGFYSEDMPVSGELRPDGKGFKIIYASHLSPARRRFTIAHEMGHAIFETTGPNCPRFGDELERLCDMLAAEILMPKEFFSKLVDENLSLQKVFELARKFETSLSSTAIRCAELQKVSIFEVQGKTVSWGYGVVKPGNLKSLGYVLGQELEEASSTETGNKTIYLINPVWSGEWKLEWTRIGQGERTLFLLQPGSAYFETRKPKVEWAISNNL
jgi:hypothetical protein